MSALVTQKLGVTGWESIVAGPPVWGARPLPPHSPAIPGPQPERPVGLGEPGTHLQQHGQQEAQVHLVEAHLAHRLERLLHLHDGLAAEDRAATAPEDLAGRGPRTRPGGEGGREDRARRGEREGG